MPPISGDVFGAILCTSLAHFLWSVLICLHDVDVAGAATKISRNRVTNIVVTRIVVRLQKRVSGHQHAGRAITTLQTVLLKESVLQRMQLAVLFETFNSQ